MNIYLKFTNDATGRVDIIEPVKFDVAAFTVEQGKGRYGRDVSFGNEDASLEFIDVYADATSEPYQLPDGTVVRHLSMGLPFLLEYWERFGSESIVEMVLEEDGETFTTGVIDFPSAKTDLISRFECKVVQENERAVFKREAETKFDVFGSVDRMGEPIEPLAPVNVLLPALPLQQTSLWRATPNNVTGVARTFVFNNQIIQINTGVNNISIPVQYSIENSLGYIFAVDRLDPVGISGTWVPNDGLNFTYLEALDELSNVEISLTNIVGSTSQIKVDDLVNNITVTSGSGRARVLVVVGDIYNAPRLVEVLYERSFGFVDSSPVVALPTEMSITIPLILRGERAYIYLELTNEAELSGTAQTSTATYSVFGSMNGESGRIKITATATGIDSIVKALPYVSLFEYAAKWMNESNVIAPKLQSGILNNLYAFSGFMARGYKDKAYYNTWKELSDNLQWLNFDYQINPDNEVFIGHEDDFYPDYEIGTYLQLSPEDFDQYCADRFLAKLVEYEFKNYEKDETQGASLDSVHTNIQLQLPNQNTGNKIKYETDLILDPKRIEKIRRAGVNTKPDASTTDDDNTVIVDTVPLAPGSMGGFSANLLQRINEDGHLQLLNSSNDEPGRFGWDSLGFGVGSIFTIVSGDNAGIYLVSEITPTVLTLWGGAPSFEGNQIITVQYPLNNVQLTVRQSQGFDLIEGIQEGFYNLLYTKKRILETYFSKQLATMTMYHPNGEIGVVVKNNDTLRTQFMGGAIIGEAEPIPVSSLETPTLSPKESKTKLLLPFATALHIFREYNRIKDGKIGGFIRVYDTLNRVMRVDLKKADYVWVEEMMELTAEVRYEPKTLVLVATSEGIVINGVSYGWGWFYTIADKLQLFDVDARPLTMPYAVDKVELNGVVFENIVDLSEELNNYMV